MDWVLKKECNILETLQDFPSVQVTADLLLTQLPLLQPVRELILRAALLISLRHCTVVDGHTVFQH